MALSKKKSTAIKDCASDKVFYSIVNIIMFVILLIVLVPILNVIASSFSSGEAVSAGKVGIWPVNPTLEGYKAVFKYRDIMTGFKNSVIYTVFGTIIHVIMTLLCAYPLSRADLPFRDRLMFLFSFTMLFGGGIIPTYLLMESLGIINTRWAILIPGSISVYNMIVTRTNFQQIPKELLEAAKIDGCSDFRFFATMVLPLSKAIIAVITLFYAVSLWNVYFSATIYLTKMELQPLQVILKNILISNQQNAEALTGDGDAERANFQDLIKYALIMVASVPVWCVYPFVQKFFVQGVMVGSIKG